MGLKGVQYNRCNRECKQTFMDYIEVIDPNLIQEKSNRRKNIQPIKMGDIKETHA
jgi:hypothetical protein